MATSNSLAASAAAEEPYRRRAALGVPVDARSALVRSHEGGETSVIDRAALDVLAGCVGFRPLAAHAEHIAARGAPSLHGANVRAILEELVRQGWLVSKRALVEQASAAATPAAQIDAICVATRNRSDAVVRCVRSYSANLRAYGRAAPWTVVESSTDPQARKVARHALLALEREGIAIGCADVPDKEAFAAALAREAGIDLSLARFALLDTEGMGQDTGANRNALLLAHAGDSVLCVDDDTVCELRRPPQWDPAAVELASFHSPPVAHFESVESIRHALPAVRESVLAAHEAFLGRSVGACLDGRSANEVTAESLSDETFEAILAGRASVGATIGGFWGDCATTSPAYYLFCEGPPPHALPRDEVAYRRIVSSRQLVRASHRFTWSSSAIVMAANLGLDLRDLSPPFFPVRRAQDLVFGALLRRCFDARGFAFVPLAAGHLPAETRRADPDALWGTARPKLAAFVFQAIQLARLDVASPGAARLRLLGRHLRELASLSWPDFERVLVPCAWQEIARDLRTVQQRLDAADPRSPWARDARAYREALLGSLRAPDLVLPEGLGARRTTNDGRALMQRLFGQFGALLEVWPDLFAAAKRLRAQGVTLVRHRGID